MPAPTTYSYWEDSLVKTIIDPNGAIADSSYADSFDNANRLKDLVNHFGTPGAVPTPPQLISSYRYTYDANGNRTTQTEAQHDFAGGQAEVTSYDYDLLNRLTHVTYGSGLGSVNVAYTYAPNGNRLTEAGTDPVTGQRVNETYGYDRINRLLCITNNDDSTHSIAYAYDADGNRTDEIVGTIHVSTDSSGNPVYIDANGNSLVTVVTAISNTPYLYGIRNELLETADSSGGFIIFDYDHNLMRVKEIISTGEGNSQETRYLYDGNVTVLEYTSNGQTTTKYNYGNNLVSMVDATQPGRPTQFYLLDGLGSTVNMTDQTGNVLDSYEYDAWGNIRASAGSSQSGKLYEGQYFNVAGTGLDYFGVRYYDPSIGEFITQDTYAGQPGNPLSINRYILSYDNPLRYIDPTGHSPSLQGDASGSGQGSGNQTEGPTIEASAKLGVSGGSVQDYKQAVVVENPKGPSLSTTTSTQTFNDNTLWQLLQQEKQWYQTFSVMSLLASSPEELARQEAMWKQVQSQLTISVYGTMTQAHYDITSDLAHWNNVLGTAEEGPLGAIALGWGQFIGLSDDQAVALGQMAGAIETAATANWMAGESGQETNAAMGQWMYGNAAQSIKNIWTAEPPGQDPSIQSTPVESTSDVPIFSELEPSPLLAPEPESKSVQFSEAEMSAVSVMGLTTRNGVGEYPMTEGRMENFGNYDSIDQRLIVDLAMKEEELGNLPSGPKGKAILWVAESSQASGQKGNPTGSITA